jgi:AbrB family looped-hinge helix DNA binding protein
MHQSVITRKGQTTIPKEIRTFLKLEPNDKLFYIVEGKKVVLKPLHGDILELRGSVPAKDQPTDFDKVLKVTRKKVAKKIVESD